MAKHPMHQRYVYTICIYKYTYKIYTCHLRHDQKHIIPSVLWDKKLLTSKKTSLGSGNSTRLFFQQKNGTRSSQRHHGYFESVSRSVSVSGGGWFSPKRRLNVWSVSVFCTRWLAILSSWGFWAPKKTTLLYGKSNRYQPHLEFFQRVQSPKSKHHHIHPAAQMKVSKRS